MDCNAYDDGVNPEVPDLVERLNIDELSELQHLQLHAPRLGHLDVCLLDCLLLLKQALLLVQCLNRSHSTQ
jgi:hypothetical protein